MKSGAEARPKTSAAQQLLRRLSAWSSTTTNGISAIRPNVIRLGAFRISSRSGPRFRFIARSMPRDARSGRNVLPEGLDRAGPRTAGFRGLSGGHPQDIEGVPLDWRVEHDATLPRELHTD